MSAGFAVHAFTADAVALSPPSFSFASASIFLSEAVWPLPLVALWSQLSVRRPTVTDEEASSFVSQEKKAALTWVGVAVLHR